jgi:hypothetical protein
MLALKHEATVARLDQVLTDNRELRSSLQVQVRPPLGGGLQPHAGGRGQCVPRLQRARSAPPGPNRMHLSYWHAE